MYQDFPRTQRLSTSRTPRKFDVPDREHQKLLGKGAIAWNRWREENPDINPRLGYTRLRGQDLSGYNFNDTYMPFSIFSRCNFKYSSFKGAELRGVSLRRADLTGAHFDGAIMRHASLAGCDVNDAVFKDCSIYGISAWNLSGEPKDQSNMAIQATLDDPSITVDDLEVAQFIFLLLSNHKIRGVIQSVTSKTVLILGRFTKERKVVLEAVRDELRKRGLVPIIFDWEPSPNRDLTETVQLLANMARFVVADVTDAKSIPQELSAIIPHLPSVPVRPLVLASQRPYAMFEHWKGPNFNSVLPEYPYESKDELIAGFDKIIMEPVELWEQKTDKTEATIGALQRANEQLREQIRQLLAQ